MSVSALMLLAMIFSLLVLKDNWQMPGPDVGDNSSVQVLSPSGNKQIDFRWRNSSGEWTELSSLHGRLVYINFWASWCEPCKKELPLIESMQKKWGENKLITILVNLDHGKELQDFARLMQLKLAPSVLSIYDGSSILENFFQVKVLPEHILIDKTGMLALQLQGALDKQNRDLEKIISNLLEADSTK